MSGTDVGSRGRHGCRWRCPTGERMKAPWGERLGRAVVPAVLAATVWLGGCGSGRVQATVEGSRLYEACESCHGTEGEGNVALGAPRIAGLPAWYVAAQLQKYRTDFRGKHPDDAEGLRMRAMSRQMRDDGEVERVSDHVSQLRGAVPPPTLDGDLAAGEEAFALCAACHGERGEGSEDTESPPLAGLDDWYVLGQLRKFQAGVRGAAEGDDTGAGMAAMAESLDEDSMRNLAAYIATLSTGGHTVMRD